MEITKDLEVEFISDGIILPFRQNDSWGLGGVLDHNMNYISSSGYEDWLTFGGKYEFSSSNILISNEEVIWFGKFNFHWGHFLLDDVSRMWYLLDHYDNQIIAYVSESNEMSENFLEFMQGLGVTKSKLLRVLKPTKFKNIIIPCCSKQKGLIHPNYHNIFLKVRDNLISSKIDEYKDLDVYLSRASFEGGKNKEVGEGDVEKIFNKNSFKSIYPEKLSLSEQVSLWNNARKIACLNGTIPLNILFTNRRGNLIVLNKTSRNHANLQDVLKITQTYNVTFINIFSGFYDKSVRYLGEGPFIFNELKYLRDFFGVKVSRVSSFKERYNFIFFVFYSKKIAIRYLKRVLSFISKR